MNDEIKEILEQLKELDNNYIILKEKGASFKATELEKKTHILYNYITNLQQENERLKKDIEVLNDRFYKMRKNKDEQFNSLYVKYTALLEYISLGYKLETPKIILENANGFNKMIVKEREDYKYRCEKADNQLKIIMQIIKEQPTRNVEDDEWIENRLISVVNILQNGGDSQ